MKQPNDSNNSDISEERVRDIEAHCRKVHAEAVAESFAMVFSLPVRLLQHMKGMRPETEMYET